MIHQMSYDTLAIELGQVALQRDTYRDLCAELLFIANNSFNVYGDILEKSGCGMIFDHSGKQIDLTEILKQLHFSKSAITKAEAILGDKNGTDN